MTKKHYHLAATEVTFVDPESNLASQLNFNVVIETEDKLIRIKEIDHIQRQAQMLFHKKTEDPTMVVVDVFIMGISYLGHMLPEAFTKRPETPDAKTQKEVQDLFFSTKGNA